MNELQKTIMECAHQGNPARFAKDDDLAVLPVYEDEEFWSERSVDGDWLAAFLTDPNSNIHRRGVTVIGARITGGLDLEAAELTRRLALVRCQLGPHGINLDEAQVRSIRFPGTHCECVSADGAEVTGDVLLADGFKATGGYVSAAPR